MVVASRHARLYQALTRLYPREFREEYRDDLVQSFCDELRDHGVPRGWARVASDLIRTVPVQHVEVHMSQHSPGRTARLRVAALISAVLAVLAAGRFVIILAPLVVIAGAVALLYWRSQVPYRDAVADASARWWQLMLAGAALFAAIAAADTYGPNDISFSWTLAVFVFLTAVSLLFGGALLGLVHLAKRLRRPAL